MLNELINILTQDNIKKLELIIFTIYCFLILIIFNEINI